MSTIDNQLLVIFGASGDLTRRKLLPSLFELYVKGLLPQQFCILGAARTVHTDESYRIHQRNAILTHCQDRSCDLEQIDHFLQLLFYQPLHPTDNESYATLKNRIESLCDQFKLEDRILFYLATPPALYDVIPQGLQQVGLNRTNTPSRWRRIIVEKPFGVSLSSAHRLGASLRQIFPEESLYRIDHYLGKETVQNILVLRFSNGIFEPLWNRNYIDSVEIRVTERLGIDSRGSYYEQAGALRDMVQNHLMQLMAFIAMENPSQFDPEAIRNEIVKVLRSLHPYSAGEIDQNVIRAQYTGRELEGKWIPGYREEAGIAPDSTTETYVALRLFIDNWRWSGVPFFLYTGKRIDRKEAVIVIHFKSTPTQLFHGQCSGSSCNSLTIRIQPDEGIALKFGLKQPGAGFSVKQVEMDFSYASLSSAYLPDAYERLLLDAMLGDSTLYARQDALEASWRFIDPILNRWAQHPDRNLYTYPALSAGPTEKSLLNKEKSPQTHAPHPMRCKP